MGKVVNAAKKAVGAAIVKWDEELAKEAELAAKMEQNSGGGQFFSVRGGILQFNDAPIPGNKMAVVILDAIFENVYYEGDFDPDSPSSPTCFALGREEATLAPHDNSVQKQNPTCDGCPQNQWGTADKGKGKACKNVRRIAMIPAGSFTSNGSFEANEDPAHFEGTSVGFMKIPVTSVKGYAAFVKQVAGTLKRPPHGIVTRVSVQPDPKTQFKVVFEPLSQLSNELLPAIMKRRDEVKSLIDFPYTPREEDAAPAQKKGKPAKRKY